MLVSNNVLHGILKPKRIKMIRAVTETEVGWGGAGLEFARLH